MRRMLRQLPGAALLSCMALSILTVPSSVRAQGLTLTGYADFEMIGDKLGSDDKEFYFDSHHVNLIMLGQISGDLYVAAEVEYEHSGDEIGLEYGYLGYTGIRNIRIMAGKFIVPFGRFNKDIHPTPVNKIPGRPHGFKDVLPQTYNDAGLWISGAAPLNDDSRVVFDVFAVNGLLGEDGGGIRSLRGADREKADFGRDDNKAVGARVGIELPFQGLDFGGSVYQGKYAESADGTDLDLTLLGVDASFSRDGFGLRGEWVHASQDATGGDLTKSGGYLQASYMANDVVEPVIRYSSRNMPADKDDLGRFAVGLNFHINSSAIVRLAYMANTEEDGFEKDNNQFVGQFNVFF